MRIKIYNFLTKAYGIVMTVSFFAGFLPIIPFIASLFIGGETAEAICTFLYNEYYVWVIAGASIAVIIGLIAMYVGKKEGLSVKSVGKK
jgi:hypothetical protein